METQKLGLRALYSVNNTPYILSLSMRKFPVTIIRPPIAHNTGSADTLLSPPVYGRAPLGPFLDMICRTSPELVEVQEGKRDFTIYVLDPLEARSAIPSIPGGSNHHSHGVATGLGLMSLALDDPECDVSVTGTLNNDGIQEERLEVILALREYNGPAPRPRKIPEASSSSRVTLDRQRGKPRATAKRTPVHAAQPDVEFHNSRTLARTTSLPPLEFRLSSKSLEKQPAVPSSFPPSSNNDPATILNQSTIQSVLSALSSTNKGPEILAALSAIDSSVQSTGQRVSPNMSLIEALSKLLYPAPSGRPPLSPEKPSASQSSQASTEAPTPSSSQSSSQLSAHSSSHSRSRTSSQSMSYSSRAPTRSTSSATLPSSPRKGQTGSDDEIVCLDKENVNPHAFRRPKSQKAPPSNDTPDASGGARKRTLSDIMDGIDRERERTRRKTFQASGSSRKVTTLSSNSAGFNAQPTQIASEPDGGTTGPSSGQYMPEPGPSSWRRSSMSSPPRPRAAPAPPPQRRKFIIPDWAKTDTATIPRFPEAVDTQQITLPEPPRLQKKKSLKKSLQRLRSENDALSSLADVQRSASPQKLKRHASNIIERPTDIGGVPAPSHPPTAPIKGEEGNAQPVIAFEAELREFHQRPTTPPPRPRLPSTPQRTGSSDEEEPLFTPLFTPIAKRKTPQTGSARKLPSLYTMLSPGATPSRKGRRPSPRRVAPNPNPAPVHLGPLADTPESDDVASPSTSLPVASSDVECDSSRPGTPATPKQEEHWSVGLPPSSPLPSSSPLPPSSPILESESDDIYTDTDTLDSSALTSDTDLPTPLPGLTDSFAGASFAPEDFDKLLSSNAFSPEESTNTFPFDLEGLSSCPTAGYTSLTQSLVPTEGLFPELSDEFNFQGESLDQMDLSNLDFNEFWESVKPLIDQNVAERSDGDVVSSPSADDLTANALKLAEDLQSLYGGCVL
ncbi:hypothetical protein PHLGIDRAFT_463273 [Phlebiopsis gigantea 11061_1 CR5-6]|uniref:Uncharacterized protein n=1 Tax=Phlebiopsis gigantea (strain 11061_1 CR5-6) TaxID=745531 RepID=A0A0C3RX53_PHLG1|nr:hypothetical protein PHLGIDRAFT_463273 [Phlebiopsis gigantea 11061_1 CR5-6]